MASRRSAYLVGFLFFVGTFGVHSTAFAKKFLIGVKGGPNFATVIGGDADAPSGMSKKRLTGFGGGAVGAINFGSVGIQPELLYTMKGVKYTSDQGDGVTTLRLNYMQIPVMFRYNISIPAVPITPKLMVGPSASFFLSGKSKTEGAGGSNSEDLEASDYRSPYYGAVGGIGLEVGLGPGALLVDARYEQGLAKIRAEGADPGAAFHSVFTGHVGFAIGF